jgi:predicted enzyme related to lactoylglutathione lyase
VGEREQYAAGTFCWTDLSSGDQPAAKEFYGALFGWQAEDMPVGPVREGAAYSIMRLRGRDVAAISSRPARQREAGVPSMWNSYVTVESADSSAERARELGALVHAPPFDVMDAGRKAVIQDPQGAFFELWEPRGHFGAALVNAPGALVWNELESPDPTASAGFYGALFGWSTEPFPGMRDPYLSVKNGQASAAGIRPLPSPGAAPAWLVYFGVADIGTALARVHELGGSLLDGPIEIPVGCVAVVSDPQGAAFALYDGELDP